MRCWPTSLAEKTERVWSGNSLNLFTPVNDYSSSNTEQISKTIRGKNSNHVAIDKRGLLLGPGPPKVLNTYPHVSATDAEFVVTTY